MGNVRLVHFNFIDGIRSRLTRCDHSIEFAALMGALFRASLLLGLGLGSALAANVTVSSFTPTRGSYMGGTLLNVTGSGFLRGNQTVRRNCVIIEI